MQSLHSWKSIIHLLWSISNGRHQINFHGTELKNCLHCSPAFSHVSVFTVVFFLSVCMGGGGRRHINIQGNFQGNLQGNFQGNLQGNFQRHFQGNFQGCLQSSVLYCCFLLVCVYGRGREGGYINIPSPGDLNVMQCDFKLSMHCQHRSMSGALAVVVVCDKSIHPIHHTTCRQQIPIAIAGVSGDSVDSQFWFGLVWLRLRAMIRRSFLRLFNGPQPVSFDIHWSNIRKGDSIKTLPEAQRTQGIGFITQIIFMTKII